MQGSNFFSVLNDFRLERLGYSAEIVPVPIVLSKRGMPRLRKERGRGHRARSCGNLKPDDPDEAGTKYVLVAQPRKL